MKLLFPGLSLLVIIGTAACTRDHPTVSQDSINQIIDKNYLTNSVFLINLNPGTGDTMSTILQVYRYDNQSRVISETQVFSKDRTDSTSYRYTSYPETVVKDYAGSDGFRTKDSAIFFRTVDKLDSSTAFHSDNSSNAIYSTHTDYEYDAQGRPYRESTFPTGTTFNPTASVITQYAFTDNALDSVSVLNSSTDQTVIRSGSQYQNGDQVSSYSTDNRSISFYSLNQFTNIESGGFAKYMSPPSGFNIQFANRHLIKASASSSTPPNSFNPGYEFSYKFDSNHRVIELIRTVVGIQGGVDYKIIYTYY